MKLITFHYSSRHIYYISCRKVLTSTHHHLLNLNTEYKLPFFTEVLSVPNTTLAFKLHLFYYMRYYLSP
jgi:hypothetical protein